MENSSDSAFINLIVAGMLLAFVLATAIVIFVFVYQRKVNAQKSKLQEVKIQHQQALIHSTLKAVEAERQQFAANLHDEIGAHLSIAKMTLSSVTPDKDKQSPISSTVEILEDAIASVHSISHNLFPPVLAKLGLEKAIASYLDKIPNESIHIQFKSAPLPVRPNRETELHTFRIFQESLSNAIKHSHGTSIVVELYPKKQHFELKISDNGTGFSNQPERIGLGLQGMKSRAEIIDFILLVESTKKGTIITLSPKQQ